MEQPNEAIDHSTIISKTVAAFAPKLPSII